jgi:hypothetical protein
MADVEEQHTAGQQAPAEITPPALDEDTATGDLLLKSTLLGDTLLLIVVQVVLPVLDGLANEEWDDILTIIF